MVRFIDSLQIPANDHSRSLSWADAIQLFKTIYMASRNLAARSRKEYTSDITQMVDFFERRGVSRVEEIGLSHLQVFLAGLDVRGLAGVTRRRKTASIRAFFAFLTAHGFLMRNPAQKLIPPERGQREPRYLTTQEYQALLRACAHETRDTAIIELLLQTGIRLSEVARLTVDDVELPQHVAQDPSNVGQVFIRGSEHQGRTLPLNFKACRALKGWLSIRPDIAEPGLFVTKFHEPMGPRAFQRVVRKYLDAAGIRHASVHTLRHTFATHHVAKGTSLRTIQEALGHADLRTTSIYVSTAKEALNRDLQYNAL